MKIKNIIILPLILSIGLYVFGSIAGENRSVKVLSLHQTCQLYLDEPMIADQLYGEKEIKSTVKISDKRKIYLLCSDAEEGTFTAEIIAKENYVLECVCNPPSNMSVFNLADPEYELALTGTFKSMTSAFFEGNRKMCKITMYGCNLKLKNLDQNQ
ncbi:MAG: hypothetical protein ACE5H1_03120 [Thermodesulfobacteriota bacterium]